MFEKQFLQMDRARYVPLPGHFVEFSAQLRKNPLIEVFESLLEIARLAHVFGEPDSKKPTKGGPGGNKPTDMKTVVKQMESFLALVKTGKMADLVTTELLCSCRCVITLENQFLNDPGMFDLVDGTFTVVGKVIKSVPQNGSVNLLRNTPVAKLPKAIFQQMTGAMEALTTTHNFALPKLDTEIAAPVIQVLPVCIFA